MLAPIRQDVSRIILFPLAVAPATRVACASQVSAALSVTSPQSRTQFENARLFTQHIAMPSPNAIDRAQRDHDIGAGNQELDSPFLDDSDDDIGASYDRDHALLREDPLADNGIEQTSFKRKQKQSTGFAGSLGSFLSPFSRGSAAASANGSSPGAFTPPSSNELHNQSGSPNGVFNTSKDGIPLDWIAEGPGRRVGYEDLTAIDWIFEYTKERQRLRMLYSNATGLFGFVKEQLDASQVWIVLVLTGISVGLIAGGIDITTNWLADLKTGYCSAGKDGGHFYLNKGFCCDGYDDWSQCQDWVSWGEALHLTSKAGSWIVEYIFFVIFSVSVLQDCQ